MYYCSPKDQAILEAEYTHNPKPNKAARAIIVEKVDMNEKEVQVSTSTQKVLKRSWTRPVLALIINKRCADMVPKSPSDQSKKVATTSTS